LSLTAVPDICVEDGTQRKFFNDFSRACVRARTTRTRRGHSGGAFFGRWLSEFGPGSAFLPRVTSTPVANALKLLSGIC
jgi:hypothetical protein